MGRLKCYLLTLNHSQTTQNTFDLRFLLCFALHLHLQNVRILANIPMWAVARLMSRKPRDSRCNQNMVPRGWLDPLEEDLSVLSGTVGSWLCGMERGGVERATTGQRERERWGVCLCTDRKGRGLSSGIPECIAGKKIPTGWSICPINFVLVQRVEDKCEDQQFLQLIYSVLRDHLETD